MDGELNTLLMRLPNLLDSRVPDGDGEEENVVVSEWGEEYIKRGEVRTWSGVVQSSWFLQPVLCIYMCGTVVCHSSRLNPGSITCDTSFTAVL